MKNKDFLLLGGIILFLIIFSVGFLIKNPMGNEGYLIGVAFCIVIWMFIAIPRLT